MKRTVYRIYTEDKNLTRVMALASEEFDGFTVTNGLGAWKGTIEKSIIIEIIVPTLKFFTDRHRVERLARCIKDLNGQESVLVTEQQIEADFI